MDVYTHIASQNLAGGATGWGLSRRNVIPEPHALVVVSEDGGLPAEVHQDEGVGDAAQMSPVVQIRTRGEPQRSDAPADKALAIRDELVGARRMFNGTPYMRVTALTPEPVYIGLDEKARPEFTISFRCLRRVVP